MQGKFFMKNPDGLREILKNTKHRKPTQIYCPRCASQKIALSSSLAVWLTPKQYYCKECGYLGIIVMELEKDDGNIKET
jgi:predicted RNA-binding Zn-ribbon protein involved in translation (DUF1610 family)